MILLLLAVIYGFSMHLSQAEDCDTGNQGLARFGPTCEYLCHCGTNQCNRETGACPNNGECDGGWMGFGCQYVNVAYNTTVNSNHLSNAAAIVDGSRDRCPYETKPIINPAYIMVSLRGKVNITEVDIFFSKSVDVPPPFSVSVSDGNQAVLCGSVDYTNGKKEYFINCSSTLYGQYLNITSQWSAGFNVCEIQVPAGRNLAYGKPAFQSSLLEEYYARNAVDGLTYHATSLLTCTHTKESNNPWWLLDLQASVMMQWFRIFNRPDDTNSDQLNERLKNFRILLSQDNVRFNQAYQDQNNGTNDPPLVIEASLKSEVLARFVKIDLQGIKRILTLCEVQVFGECLPGYYGGNCNKSCFYCKNLDCDKITGRCQSCVAGKQGDQCQFDCLDGFYGDNCSHRCGRCLDLCDKSDGHCPRGCQNGWKGAGCEQECDLHFYGNCSTPCGHCAVRESCNKVNGSCDVAGCESGWQTENCNIPCAANYYGNCSTRCGHCKDSSVCNQVNGSCASGLCSEGWKSDKCDKECSSTYYGLNCAQPCGHCQNNTCDRYTGNCSENGCEPGWQGSRCDIPLSAKTFQQQPVTDNNVVVISASVGAAVVIAATIFTVVICITIKRRRKKERLSSKAPNRNLSRKKEDNIVYENSTFLDINDGDVQDVRNETTEGKRKTGTKLEKDVVVPVKEDSEPYYNIGTALPSGTISLSKFWDYVQEKFLDENFFSEEFEKLPSGPQHPTTVAQRPENKNKNRYKQLYPYDANRVLLKPLGDDKNDYINASFIDGFSQEKMYIASQGPTKDNVNDFWRMLWQNDVEKIVMLTGLFEGGRHKCELYWPQEEGNINTFGCVAVRLLDTDSFADYDIHTLQMSVGNKSKQLSQFHYTAWPDKGVPRDASSIVQFWNRVNRLPTKKPIVVHCSAGIGRTGTYIALDYIVNQAKTERHLNVSACVSNLRHQRVNLVQTEEQYIFLHETLVEALMLSGTATSSDKFPKVYQDLLKVDGDSGKIKLHLEYERLQNEAENHETVYATIKCADEEGTEAISNVNEYSAAKKSENRAKNRYDNILPVDRYRVSLITHVSGGNDYINAVMLPGHRKRKGFILTQTPLTDTVADFWRMIHDFEVETIIMFGLESSKTHDIGIYWPNDGEVYFGSFMVRLTNEEERNGYIERTLSLSLNGQKRDRTVRQFQFKIWDENSDVPESTESFLQLLEAVEEWQKERDAKPAVVHCLNGAHKSGLYCVMSTVIERLRVERDVAIAQTIKRMRSIRQQIIPNYEQFRFCHESVLQYMKTFDTYSNF